MLIAIFGGLFNVLSREASLINICLESRTPYNNSFVNACLLNCHKPCMGGHMNNKVLAQLPNRGSKVQAIYQLLLCNFTVYNENFFLARAIKTSSFFSFFKAFH